MKAVGYVHAPPAQAGHPELGLAAQRERITRHIAERGWQLEELFEEPGTGGRPALARLETDLEGMDKLVVVKLDRVARSVDGALRFVRHLDRQGVDLVCLHEGLDTGEGPAGSLAALIQQFVRWQRIAEARGGWQPEMLRKPDFSPATLIDVGVGTGTGPLYAAFPDAFLVLVEPLAEFEPQMSRIVGERRGEYILTAVGSSHGEAQLNVDREWLFESSLRQKLGRSEHPREARSIPITTLDALRAERDWTPPFGLKIDTEGFEDEVIAGAAELLRDTQFVLAEVWVAERFEGSYTFSEFVAAMDKHGFRLCDVMHVARPRPDRDVQFIDGLFRRND